MKKIGPYLNSQKYSECQLVTIINAAIFLGESPIDPDSEEYERLVDVVKARIGAAITIDKAIEYLRLNYDYIPKNLRYLKKYLRNGYPVEIGVQHHKTGFHSCLVVDERNNYLKVANFRHVTSKHGWIHWNTLKKYVDRGTIVNVTPCKGRFRYFFIDDFIG